MPKLRGHENCRYACFVSKGVFCIPFVSFFLYLFFLSNLFPCMHPYFLVFIFHFTRFFLSGTFKSPVSNFILKY
ncbi:hypothetical protein RIF29_31879 [Crotalaria pallida]|uniref:Uncharacterized protein n=1 Tax=Crotalaria pallida TaxID=3830 RepID=A0AAN9HZ28_CROPI